MADVFLSYSSADRAKAVAIERALSSAGYEVFWDQETPAGVDWDAWIREKLAKAKVVVVLWSKTSIASPNVRHEAMIARDGSQLIPVLVDALKPTDFPMGLYLVQALSLAGWNGDQNDPRLHRLLDEVAARMNRPVPVRAPVRKRLGATLLFSVMGALALLMVGGGYYVMTSQHARDQAAATIATTTTTPVDPASAAAALLEGRWHWSGIACNDGPTIARDGDALTVRMDGVPTYRHAIDSVSGSEVHTIVVEPDSDRGQAYKFVRAGQELTLTTVADGRVDHWEKCP